MAASTVLILIINPMQNDALVASNNFNLETFINSLIPEKNHAPAPEPDITYPGPDTASFPPGHLLCQKVADILKIFPLY